MCVLLHFFVFNSQILYVFYTFFLIETVKTEGTDTFRCEYKHT